MKILNIFFAFASLFFLVNSVNAQNHLGAVAGIYLTADDFQQQKITYAIDCSNSANKIRTNELLGSSKGYVLSNGEKHEFNKKNVYGYHSCNNKSYRFYKGETYMVMDTAGFYIYFQYRQEENVKGKGLVKKDEYFFSQKADGELQLMTIYNLKKSFPDNHPFHYLLDANFKSDNDLLAYDNFNKEYKVKYLFNQSLK